MENEMADVQTIDCAGKSAASIAEVLAAIEPEQSVKLVGGSDAPAGVGSGAWNAERLEVGFSLGDFAFMLAEGSHAEVGGDVGHACGCSMVGGTVIVRGKAGNQVAIHAGGGLVVVLGSAGDFVGQGLAGADAFVRSKVGNAAGFGMVAGTLLLGNGAGENLGHKMRGGVMYVRGDVASVSPDVRKVRMKDADFMRVGLLLARVGIKSDGKDFRAYRSRADKG